MHAGADRTSIDNTSGLTYCAQLFQARVGEVHSLIVRPDDAIEINFKAFEHGKGFPLDTDESFSMTWQDFRPFVSNSEYAEVWATCASGDTANVTVAYLVV